MHIFPGSPCHEICNESCQRSRNATALTLYKNLLDKEFFERHIEYKAWTTILQEIKTEWDVIKGLAGAAGAALNIDGKYSA
ncbi:MAG: hypothetical protein U9N60_03020 [Thermodesulfobacteriota bacterium]|nr:hypothetical protein [Thermodesulfobacteriota bacterium]